jgi:deglycase
MWQLKQFAKAGASRSWTMAQVPWKAWGFHPGADGFEKVELTEPHKALDEASAKTRIVSPKSDRVRSWNFTDWDQELPVDVSLAQAKSEDFDALLLPGGVINTDALRIQPKAVAFVKAFFDGGKPFAAICHGPLDRNWGG